MGQQERVIVDEATDIIVRKDHLSIHLLPASILLLQVLSITLYGLAEYGPACAADIASQHRSLAQSDLARPSTRGGLLIDKLHNVFSTVNAFVPVLPNERTGITFWLEQLDTIVEFSHALCNLARRICMSKVLGLQSPSMQKLLEAAILEGAKHAWSYVLLA